MSEEVFDSAFQRRAAIAELVEDGVTDGAVLSHLIVNGQATSHSKTTIGLLERFWRSWDQMRKLVNESK